MRIKLIYRRVDLPLGDNMRFHAPTHPPPRILTMISRLRSQIDMRRMMRRRAEKQVCLRRDLVASV